MSIGHTFKVMHKYHFVYKCSTVAEMGDRLATIDMGRKLGEGSVPLLEGGGAESPSNTMWPGPSPTSVPSFILIHPTVWPQYTDVKPWFHVKKIILKNFSVLF